MKRVRGTLTRVIDDGPQIKSFSVRLSEPLAFQPGQAITVMLGSKKRAYSIASTPKDPENILFTVKGHADGYLSPDLFKLKEGDEIDIIGPYGTFTVQEGQTDKYTFIAGGVGITPFRSCILHATQNHWPVDLMLIYSAANVASFTYKQEFDHLTKNGLLKTYYTVTGQDDAWNGPRGLLTEDVLRTLIDTQGLYYVCGPPAFNTAMMQTLIKIGVPKERIRQEQWE